MDLPGNLTLVLNSALLALGVSAISLPMGAVLGLLLTRTDLPGRKCFAALLATFLFVPLYLQAAGWQAAFGVQGWSTAYFSQAAWLAGWRGAIWVHSMAAIPWVALIVGAGVWSVEPELEEDALLDASAGRVFAAVTLRRALAAVGVAALWILVSTAGEMTVTDFFQIRTYAEEIYINFNLGPEPADVALAALPGALFIGCLVLAALVGCARLAPNQRQASTRPPVCFNLGHWRWPCVVSVSMLLLLVVAMPIVNLLFKAGEVTTASAAGLSRGWSPIKCLRFIANSPFRYDDEIAWSLLIASLAATAAVVVAVQVAWFACRGGWRATLSLLMTSVLLALPGPVIGVAIMSLMNQPAVPLLTTLYDRSIAAPWCAMLLRSLPLATLVAWYALRGVPRDTLDAAAADGAGPQRRLWLVAVPQRVAGLSAAWLVAFVIALGDLAASILVLPPGMTTISVRVFQELHSGQEDYVAGICLALSASFGALTLTAAWLMNRTLAKEGRS